MKRKTDAPRRAAITPKQQTLIAVAASGVLLIVLLNGIHLWESFAEESREVQTRNDASSRRAGLPVEAPAPPPPHGQPPPVPPASMVRKDDGGRVLEVRGPNPRAVLTQFCESSSGTNRFQPVELTSTVPPVSGSRLGLFRDFDDLESLYAIRIRKDPRSRRWVAGDGRGPVRVTPAPDLPADAQRTPVEVP